MKDIIAAQHVQPRRKPSLLAHASEYHSLTKQIFFGQNQKTMHRESSPVRNKLPPRKEQPRGKSGRTGQFAGFQDRKGRIILLAAILTLLLIPVLVIMLDLTFIPDPDPPEESLGFSEEQFRLASPGVFDPETGAAGQEIPLDLTETFAWQEYRVRRGDSVEGIARRFGLSLDAVIASNNLKKVRDLRAGEKIHIPNMDGIPYTVRNGDSYSRIAASMQVPLEVILDANDIQSEAISAGTVLFIPGAKMTREALREALGEMYIYPIRGRQTSPFGWRNDPFTGMRSYHAALDLAASHGTPVKASSDGRVSAAGYNAIYGNFIILTHSGGYQTMYGHLSKIMVSRGSSVAQGKVIGLVGSTGRSTGAHLHFAAYKNGRAINPLELLNK
jgi:murein DD-endopeptidase MepM/ murein hydrolase activator NlpD